MSDCCSAFKRGSNKSLIRRKMFMEKGEDIIEALGQKRIETTQKYC